MKFIRFVGILCIIIAISLVISSIFAVIVGMGLLGLLFICFIIPYVLKVRLIKTDDYEFKNEPYFFGFPHTFRIIFICVFNGYLLFAILLYTITIDVADKPIVYYFWILTQLISIILTFSIPIVHVIYFMFYFIYNCKRERFYELRTLALDYYNKTDYEKAIEIYKRALKYCPRSSSILGELGAAYNKAGNYPSAIFAFKRAIIWERNTTLHEESRWRNCLGYAYYKKKEYDNAIEAFIKALEIDTNYDLAAYNLAKVYLKLERYDDAIEAIEYCLDLNPNSDKAKELRTKIDSHFA